MISVPSCLTLTLSWLWPGINTPDPPSFIQNSVGVGFPAATQSRRTEELRETRVEDGGRTRKMGGAAREIGVLANV